MGMKKKTAGTGAAAAPPAAVPASKKSAIDEMVDEASKRITKLADEKKQAIETRQD